MTVVMKTREMALMEVVAVGVPQLCRTLVVEVVDSNHQVRGVQVVWALW